MPDWKEMNFIEGIDKEKVNGLFYQKKKMRPKMQTMVNRWKGLVLQYFSEAEIIQDIEDKEDITIVFIGNKKHPYDMGHASIGMRNNGKRKKIVIIHVMDNEAARFITQEVANMIDLSEEQVKALPDMWFLSVLLHEIGHVWKVEDMYPKDEDEADAFAKETMRKLVSPTMMDALEIFDKVANWDYYIESTTKKYKALRKRNARLSKQVDMLMRKCGITESELPQDGDMDIDVATPAGWRK